MFSVRLHGEAGGADQQGITRAQTELPSIIERDKPEDVFNLDETGLYYRQAVSFLRHHTYTCHFTTIHVTLLSQPDHTLTTTADIRGAKKSKARVTVALIVNVTGTERLKPIVIHKFKCPRCFGKTFDPNSMVFYCNNQTAWMRIEARTE